MALTNGVQISKGIQPTDPVPVDSWSGPYEGSTEVAALTAAATSISSAVRFKSLEVRLIINGSSKKYWYKNGITDNDLIEYFPSTAGNLTGSLTLSTFSSNDALRITQSGTGNALVIEDSETPDSTSFIVNSGGNVGVGINLPLTKLHVGGIVRIESAGTGLGGQLELLNSPNNSVVGKIEVDSSGNTRVSHLSSSGSLIFYTNNSEKMRVNELGNIGIGTSTPNEILTVVGNLSASGTFNNITIGRGKNSIVNNSGIGTGALNNITTGDNNTALGVNALYSDTIGNNNISIGNDSLKLNTTGSQNIAIGTGALLSNTTGSQNIYIGINSNSSRVSSTNEMAIGYNVVGIGDNTIVLGNSSILTTRLQGNVGVGTNNPNEKLTVSGNISASGNVYDSLGNSANWNSVYTTVSASSANWNSVYTSVSANSGTYATISFVNNKFLPLSGGIITGDLTLNGNLSTLGTTTQIDT